MAQCSTTLSVTFTRRARIALAGFMLAARMGVQFDQQWAARLIIGLMAIEVR